MIDLPVWVSTERFEVSRPGPHFINPRCFGEDFAAWLAPRLQAAGLDVSDPIQEDWGWLLVVVVSGYRFGISIGVMDASLGVLPADWRIGVGYERLQNSFRAWFQPVPFELLQATANTVRGILQSEPTFTVSYREP